MAIGPGKIWVRIIIAYVLLEMKRWKKSETVAVLEEYHSGVLLMK